MMRGGRLRAVLAAAVLGLAGCAPTAAPVAPPAAIAPTPAALDASRMRADATIAANLTATPGLGTLAAGVQAAGMTGLLAGPGPLTLFAPTDAAFGRLAPGVAAALLQPENRATLDRLLRHHLVPGRVSGADLVARVRAGGGQAMLPTLSGAPLRVGEVSGVIVLTSETGSHSYVEAADLAQANGTVHVVNGVLVPKVD